MIVHQAIDIFHRYSPQDKIDVLVHFAHALTILARDTYEVGGEGLTQPSRHRRRDGGGAQQQGDQLAHRVSSPRLWPTSNRDDARPQIVQF